MDIEFNTLGVESVSMAAQKLSKSFEKTGKAFNKYNSAFSKTTSSIPKGSFSSSGLSSLNTSSFDPNTLGQIAAFATLGKLTNKLFNRFVNRDAKNSIESFLEKQSSNFSSSFSKLIKYPKFATRKIGREIYKPIYEGIKSPISKGLKIAKDSITSLPSKLNKSDAVQALKVINKSISIPIRKTYRNLKSKVISPVIKPIMIKVGKVISPIANKVFKPIKRVVSTSVIGIGSKVSKFVAPILTVIGGWITSAIKSAGLTSLVAGAVGLFSSLPLVLGAAVGGVIVLAALLDRRTQKFFAKVGEWVSKKYESVTKFASEFFDALKTGIQRYSGGLFQTKDLQINPETISTKFTPQEQQKYIREQIVQTYKDKQSNSPDFMEKILPWINNQTYINDKVDAIKSIIDKQNADYNIQIENIIYEQQFNRRN